MKKKLTLFVSFLLLAFIGCERNSFIDDTEFALYYKSIKPITLGSAAVSQPSYIGSAPADFRIYSITHNGTVYYNPKLDGELDSNDEFYIVSETGDFNIHKSTTLKPGTYKVSIECKSAGKLYKFPDAIEIVMSK